MLVVFISAGGIDVCVCGRGGVWVGRFVKWGGGAVAVWCWEYSWCQEHSWCWWYL